MDGGITCQGKLCHTQRIAIRIAVVRQHIAGNRDIFIRRHTVIGRHRLGVGYGRLPSAAPVTRCDSGKARTAT